MYRIKTFNKISPVGLNRLDPALYSVSDSVTDEDAILVRSAKLLDYDFPKDLLAIARAGAGVNNIPLDRCAEQGIVVFNTPGANANAVKELVLCAMLMGSRDVDGGIQWVRQQVAAGVDVTTVVDWVLDELRPLADESHYRADRHEAFRKVKRINSCSRHQLGIARELAAWREDRAERRNIPRKWVMSDDTLLALVKRNPVRVEEFRSIRGTDQLGERDVDGALMAIKRGASCPHDRLPLLVRGHRQISPELESVTDLMYALIRLVAERSGVATSVIASRDDLADYIEHPEQSRLREGWRFELVGSRLDDLLSGNMGLTVKDGKIELL